MRINRAFTLLELLIVIAIVIALAALLVSALARSRERARIAVCAGKLQQIGRALLTYQADYSVLPNGNTMPPPFNLDSPALPTTYIHETLAAYIPPTSGCYRCPNDSTQIFPLCAAASPQHYGTSYVYNGWSILRAHKLGLLRYNDIMWDYPGNTPGAPPVEPKLHPLHNPRVPQGVNLLLLDGSVHFDDTGE